MALSTTDAIILQAIPYGETSRILRLLTRTHGVQSVIARGALRPRSSFGGVLEPFTIGSATFQYKDSRDLHTLAGFELTWGAQQLGGDLLRFGAASLYAEILIRTGSEQADPALYDAAENALQRLATIPREELEPTALAETWALVATLGFAPALEECIGCGEAVRSAEETTFDYTAGGVRCTACGVGVAGRALPANARAALIGLVNGVAVPLPRTAAHWRLLTRYLAHHVVGDTPLRSLAFLATALDSASP
jgi:DNA repair protein RecO (recombination protein O)